jgi:hypothetical protein
MDAKRFDDFTRQLGSRLSRRRLMKRGGLLAAAAVVAHQGGASAQDGSVTTDSRFISVRRYDFSGSIDDARAALHDLIRVMEQQPGFIRFDLVDAGDNGILAISTFLSRDMAIAAASEEDAWIDQNANDVLPGDPEILSGDVFLRSDIHTGCGCITGTQDPCNSERLTCCPTTDRMGGPGICLTNETTCPAVGGEEPTATAVAPTQTAAPEPTVAPVEPTATATEEPACTGEGCACNTGVEGACDDGLVCCTGDPDAAPGAPGVCRTEDECGCTAEGCHCNGGVEGNCDDGLVCCQDEPGTPGGAGTCVTTDNCAPPPCTSEGCTCATGTQNPCDQGLVCCNTDPNAAPGAPGTCRSEDACECTAEGCHCHAGVDGACDDGLTCCQGEPAIPGGPGICQATC